MLCQETHREQSPNPKPKSCSVEQPFSVLALSSAQHTTFVPTVFMEQYESYKENC